MSLNFCWVLCYEHLGVGHVRLEDWQRISLEVNKVLADPGFAANCA